MLSSYFENQKIVIVGFGREGQSTYQYVRKQFPKQIIAIADQNTKLSDHPLILHDPYLELYTGEIYLKGLDKYDLILRTPGIALSTFLEYGIEEEKISSQTDLFLRAYSDQTIGITGTKGKSTTTHLLYQVLKKQYDSVLMAGNMGIPFFDIVDKIKEETLIVCELSAHQLEGISKAPHISVLLNLFEEHLDYYISYEHYQMAKMNIALLQEKEDLFIYSQDNKTLTECVKKSNIVSKQYTYSLNYSVQEGCFVEEGWVWFKENNHTEKIYDTKSERSLKGSHNVSNILSVCIIATILNIPKEAISKAINEFKGLEHRLEFVGVYQGISFYNDSISTIPQATIEAVLALKEVDTLILGGFDRGIDYKPLCSFLENSSVLNLVFVGEAGKKIKSHFTSPIKQNYIIEDDYKEIVKWCFLNTRKGKVCLLSPAASSYDHFKNFEERGHCFKNWIIHYK